MKLYSRSKTAGIVALLLLAVMLGAGVQASMAAEQTLTISVSNIEQNITDPTISGTLMPGIGSKLPLYYQYYTHFSPLISVDGQGNIIPWMAESYEVSDDYKTITFHLRKGIKFADGTPLNASILKFNFDRIIKYGWADTWGPNSTISTSNVWVNYDYSEAPDDYTFKIHFTKGWPDMPFTLAPARVLGFFISPLDVSPAWDIKGTLRPEKMYNGLGPYYIDENESIPKQKIVLKRRHSWLDDYNFHKPKLDKIVLTYIADPQTAVLALEKGDIDYISRDSNAPLDALPKLEKNPDITIKTSPEVRIYLLETAYWKEPFKGTDGILLRKAICYALNRTEIVEGAFNGYAEPVTDAVEQSPRRPDIPQCCAKGYDYNLDKAKQLLKDAGWNDTNGDGILDKNGKPLKLSLIISSSSSSSWQKDLALVVQSQLKKVGIDVQIQTLEQANYLAIMKAGQYDLGMNANNGRGNPLSGELSVFNFQTGYKNWYENQNGTLKTIAENARNTINKEEREKCLCQMCDILYDEAGVIPLVYEMQYAVMSSKVKGFEFGPSKNNYWLDHVEECWVEK